MTTTSPPSRNFFTGRPFLISMAAIVLLCGGFLVFKLVRDNTTLSFRFLLDGKSLSVGMTPTVKVDGLPFTSGCTITPGSHELAVELPNAESFALHVRVLYGNKNLGDLPLESIKGSLLVSVNPSPASVTVRMGTKAMGNGDAPLTLEKLPLGDYDLEIKHGEYKETHSVKIQGKQRVEVKIDLDLGGVALFSDPADAEFELSRNGQNWQGKLPVKIDAIPGGSYNLVVRRKGWELNENISITRGNITTNKIEFQYGSIDVTSDPAGLLVSTNGVEIGKTPLLLQEMRPGQYALSVTDGENDLMLDVRVASKEAAKPVFSFHYGAVQLSSTPAGATVFRKGKEIGKTPLPLAHIPAGETMVELRLQDYVSTNFSIQAVEGVTTNLSVKLISEHYLKAMQQARDASNATQFAESQKFLITALEVEPNDPAATELQNEVSKAISEGEETARREHANDIARTVASLTWLDFQKVISDCTDTKQVQYSVEMNDGFTDKKGRFHKTGTHTVWQTRTENTFNPIKFSENYQGRTFGFNCPDRWGVSKVEKEGGIILKAGGFGSDEISVTASMSNRDAFKSLQTGQKVTIKAVLRKYDSGFVVRTLYLEDAEILDK